MKDVIGQDLYKGDYVAALYSENETPDIFQVNGFTPKKVRVAPISNDGEVGTKFPANLLKVDKPIIDDILQMRPTDNLGQELFVGDFVYGSDGAYIDPIIFEIQEFIPRKAILKKVLGSGWVHDRTRYTQDLIKVEPTLVTMGILKRKEGE